ncbi:hypothetical protein MHYP_G00156370 [Metynnis hypsauchen]
MWTLLKKGERETFSSLTHGTHFPAFSLSQRYILHLLVNLFTSEPQSVMLWVEADLMLPHGSSRDPTYAHSYSCLPNLTLLLPTTLRLTCFIATRAPRILNKTEAELRVPPSHANSIDLPRQVRVTGNAPDFPHPSTKKTPKGLHRQMLSRQQGFDFLRMTSFSEQEA